MRTELLAFALIAIFLVQIPPVVRHEVMTYDEGYPPMPASDTGSAPTLEGTPSTRRASEAHAEYARAEEIASAEPEWYFLSRPEIQKGVRETVIPEA